MAFAAAGAGPRGTVVMLDHFAASPAQLVGFLGVGASVIAMIVLGAAAATRDRLAEADLIVGWAVVSITFTIVGVASEIPFTIVFWLLAAGAVVAGFWVWHRDGKLVDAALGRITFFGAPLIILVAAMSASQWDEFTNWLPNARYLWEVDTFPRVGYPKNPSVFPAYPDGLSFVIYLASRVAGAFVENAGALFNLALYFALSRTF